LEGVVDLSHALKIVKGVVMLAAAAFIVTGIVGVYTALNSAPSYSLASSKQVTDPLAGALPYRGGLVADEDAGAGGAAEDEVVPAAGLDSDGEEEGAPAFSQPATAASPDHKSAAFAGDTQSEYSTDADAGFTGTGSRQSLICRPRPFGC
jgi:hypothetical protein